MSLVSLATLWMIWKEMNERAFEDREDGFDKVKSVPYLGLL